MRLRRAGGRAAAVATAFDPAAPQLEVQDLRLRAGHRDLPGALSLQVRAGELWCLLGPNGSGKSTLLHTLAGLQPAAGGRIVLCGRELDAWPPGERACLRGLLPQALHDAFTASVMDTVLLGRHPHLSRWSWEDERDRAIAREALASVGLGDFAARDVTTLSGGERQRVGIAALMAQDPLLLLLDEPIAHLDLHQQVQVLQHLRARVGRGGRAAILSIHDLNLARRVATHAVLLGGPVVVAGPVDAVMREAPLTAAFGHPVTRHDVGGRLIFVPG